MRLSLQAQYAICGMFDLAYGASRGPVQVRVIGERQRIPGRFLEQIFQRLRKADLVRGKRGPGGGYVLARPAGEITLRDVLEAVEGPVAEDLAMGPPPREGRSAYRPHFLWRQLSARLEDVFEAHTLEDLCARAAASGVKKPDAEAPEYVI
jgi:Rrf2 family iron-sulfur cluster assembly transcriptional regulator